MRFGVLGPLAVWRSDGGTVPVPGPRTRTLLAALLAHEGHPVSADRLVDALWEGTGLPSNPAAALQTRIWQLRKLLEDAEPGGRALLTLQDGGYLLRTIPDSVDMGRFEALTARARATDDPETRVTLLTDALALWRGEAFTGFEDTAFALPIINRLNEARLTALEARAEAQITLGDHLDAAARLHELAVRHPLRERLHVLHMRALHAAGRTSEALDRYRELRNRLADELGLDPGPEITALHQAILTQDPALNPAPTPAPNPPPSPVPDTTAPTPPRRPATNLPAPLTGLIGRNDAVTEVTALLATTRHVTLTGPGGVGKTRLALETATRLAGDFPDGTWLVELAALGRTHSTDTVDAAAEAVMTTLGLREETPATSPADNLATALAGKRLLLVLDNCEHLLDPIAELATLLLRRVPALRILATSQEPVGIPGETTWTVPPLETPDTTHDTDPTTIARSSAVELFVTRAAATTPGFTLNTGNAHDIAVICRRLDGIPLALELAATRVRTLGVRGLVTRLDDRFRLLATGYRSAPPRQRTLRATIDWSWDLLTGPERAVLRRLAVHAEGCTLDAAETLCAGPEVHPQDVLDLLSHLVDRSLVVMTDSTGEPRYRLLESVADYSLARLHEANETADTRRRHRHYYTDLAERTAPLLHGPHQHHHLRLLDLEAANLRRALDDAVQNDATEDALRLVNALAWYWFLRGRLREAGRSIEAALATARRNPPRTPSPQARARAWQAAFTILVGDTTRQAHHHTTLDLLPDITDPRERARARWFLGFALFGVGDQATSEELIDQALTEFQALDDTWGTAAALSVRANQAHVRGDLHRLAHDGQRSADLFTELADAWGRLQTIEPLASLAEMAGDYPHATRLHQEGLQAAEDLGLWPEAAERLTSLGTIAMLTGDHTRARELHQRAMRLAAEHSYRSGEIHAEIGLSLGARREGELDTAETHLRRALRWQTTMAFAPGLALVSAELGFIAEIRGDADEALRLHTDGWAAASTTGDPRAMALALEGLAGAHALAGRHTYAAVLLGAAHAARESVGMPLPPAERVDVDRITKAIHRHLSEDAYQAAFRHGHTLTPEEALSDSSPTSTQPGNG
ncbi:BTAD domain-containing putative transcriptional regulator [Actinomadura kijaniata]|uniref:BTAD domain-containing putative transcriptional regulator n=1 Tax=Actinomadura kijaniata TaxID=46161 RepID=UPI00082BD3E7|nr:BTAD domain-containing putative transcriptional regulator [Actinomadura kijaniata]